ncbi:unnamed protein product [Rangifer tarandus platyrhynchus]|uniref:Uncharacterized protein n=1 Tax=Rangifer tarandus platyrhynchus TaxID=3082113 RepID=A0ABN8ZZL9_RANTA|nr:unnamed protein product [Rangifer tarandus platyrhynchus]
MARTAQKPTICPEPATPGAGIAAVAAAAVGDEGEVPEEDKALIHVPAMAPCTMAFRGQLGLRMAELRTLGVDVEGGVPSGDAPALAAGGWLQGHAQLARQRASALEAAASPSGGTRDESTPSWGDRGSLARPCCGPVQLTPHSSRTFSACLSSLKTTGYLRPHGPWPTSPGGPAHLCSPPTFQKQERPSEPPAHLTDKPFPVPGGVSASTPRADATHGGDVSQSPI